MVAKLIVTAVIMAAEMALTASRKIKGPRLDDLSVTLADYGSPIPRFWGKRRLQGQVIWAEHLREKKTTNKTKGGKFQEYKYYGTWAVLICDHEIDDIGRIWLDKHLVYQVTAAGPISAGSLFAGSDSIKLARGKNLRVYKGTEDQNPDPRIESWCEDRYGPDTCPAYRGSSYLVFEDVPLEKFGNRIPQVTIEAFNNKSDVYPVESVAYTAGINTLQFTPDFMRLYMTRGDGLIQVFDVPTRSSILNFNATSGYLAFAPNTIYANDGFPSYRVLSIGYDGGASVLGTGSFGGPFIDYASYVGGTLVFRPYGGITPGFYYWDGIAVQSSSLSFIPDLYFNDLDGNGWAVGEVPGENKVGFATVPAGTEQLVDTTTTGTAYAMCNADGKFLVWQGGKLFVVDPGTWTASAPVTASFYTSDPETVFRGIAPGTESIWLRQDERSTADGSLIRSVNISNWGTYTGGLLYDPVNHALIHAGGATLNWLYLDRVGSNGVTLATVVDDVSEWCGQDNRDTSALTQTVLGYSVTPGSGKDMLDPLLDIHDVDARPHDFSVQFLNRGSAASGTHLTEDFVRGSDPRYTVTVQQDTDLPKRITFNFADEGKDQQTNTAIAQRPLDATDSTREEQIDLTTYVDTPSGAQQKADRFLRRLWNSRERIKLSLTHQALALEPGDVTSPNLDGVARTARLDKLTITPTSLDCEFVRDDPSLNSLQPRAGAEMDGRDPETIYIPGPAKGFIIDGPLVQDADNDVNPILYYAAGGYNDNFPGAPVYRGDDGTYDTLFGYVETTSDATWGIAQSVLATANPNLWDRGNTLDVSIYGTLTNATEAEIDVDGELNLLAVGQDDRWEYLQFTTATLTGTSGEANLYTLSGLKRGRRGTEGNVGNHASGDQILMLPQAIPTEVGTDEIGNDMSFKIQSAGRNIDTAPAIDLTYNGNSLRPYAPARIIWTTDGTDMFGEIIRRTRVGGTWNGGSTIPLSENSEAYEVDIYNGATFKRTITVTGTNLFTYTGTEIAADGNTVGVTPTFEAFQMSDVAGRGFALAA